MQDELPIHHYITDAMLPKVFDGIKKKKKTC